MKGIAIWLCVLLVSGNPSAQAIEIGIAAFNIAWAGSEADFKEHVRVCSSPSVNWCDTRAAILPGNQTPTAKEEQRAKQCRAEFDAVAGGSASGLLVAPCNAYKLTASKWKKASPSIYTEKLDGLRKTIDILIRKRHTDVIAFQEVRSAEVIQSILGDHANEFDVCIAKHASFQTLGFAWRRSITSKPGFCASEHSLSVKESPNDPTSIRYLRPGLALSLSIGNEVVTLMNVHLKSSCANLVDSPRFKGRELTDSYEACRILNRQLEPLEAWIEKVAILSPHFVLLGDFNRRLDEEASRSIPKDQVRKDHTDPAIPNKLDSNGEVTSRFMWQELSDGNPELVQIPLSVTNECSGFIGLDHIVISKQLEANQVKPLVSEKIKAEEKDKQMITTSDHCARVTILSL